MTNYFIYSLMAGCHVIKRCPLKSCEFPAYGIRERTLIRDVVEHFLITELLFFILFQNLHLGTVTM